MKMNFEKGKIYNPDCLDELPKDCNKYFSDEGFEELGKSQYEYGTLRCIQSFEIEYKIKIIRK